MTSSQDIVLHRLREDESIELRCIIQKELLVQSKVTGEEDDYIDLIDYALVMITNGKTVSYIVEELESMEMDVCDAKTAERIGERIKTFMYHHHEGNSCDNDTNKTKHESVVDDNNKRCVYGGVRKIISLRSVKSNNALTNSGALVVSRDWKSGQQKQQKCIKNAEQSELHGEESNSCVKHTEFSDESRAPMNGQCQSSVSIGSRVLKGRSIASDAFQRLSQQKIRDNDQGRMRGSHDEQIKSGGNDFESGRVGRRGRGYIRRADRGRPVRGSLNERNYLQGQQHSVSRQKLLMEREIYGLDKGSYNRRGLCVRGNTRSNSKRYGCVREKDVVGPRGNAPKHDRKSKKVRYEDQARHGKGRVAPTAEVWNEFGGQQDFDKDMVGREYNDKTVHNLWCGGHDYSYRHQNCNWYNAHPGRGFERGRGYGCRGREFHRRVGEGGSAVFNDKRETGRHLTKGGIRNNTQSHESILAAAEASPSPLVAASFTGRPQSGRRCAYSSRGRGRRDYPERTDVVAMLALKTWRRKKATTDG